MTLQFDKNGFALTSGEVTVYTADHNGIFSHKTTEYISEGGSLAAGSFLDAPPQAKTGFAIVRQENGWGYVADNRGTYYNTETGEQVEHTELGELPQNLTKIKPLDVPCKWDGEKWVIDQEKLTALRAEQRIKIRAAINAKRDECVDGGAYVPEIDKWVDSNEKGRATLVEIKADFDLNGKENTYTLICADNTAHVINYEEFRAVWNAVKSLKEKMFENAYMHKVLLENTENPLDYDWSIGWSETYEDYLKKQK